VGEYQAWLMPSNQYPYPERRAGPNFYNHMGVNPYDRLGPYHESNGYHHHTYGYYSGSYPPHGNRPPGLPSVGFGSDVQGGREVIHPSTKDSASEPLEVEPTREG